MGNYVRHSLMAVLLGLLVACGGGGGGNSAPGVEPGPAPPSGPVTPPDPQFPNTNPSPYAEASVLSAFISEVSLNDSNQAVVKFQLTDGENVPIIDLSAGDIRLALAKLRSSELGGLTGNWQSYINQIEESDPSVGTGTSDRLQATAERATAGELVNNADGSYVYTFNTSLTALPQDILVQASSEGLDLSFEAGRTHRVAIQFDGAPGKANPHYDWIPDSGATSGIPTMDIAATENCNRCHDPIALHGGGRQEVEYCVTCHNAGSTDANSTNTVDFKVMIHKIHRGANLPSVADGGEYAIYGFRNSKHDYSELHLPQDIRNCVNCHAGSATGADRPDLVLTAQGDNWAHVPSQAACGSCHENLDFTEHAGGQEDDTNCASCHSEGGIAGTIANDHRIEMADARKTLKAEITAVDRTMPGQFPVVSFKVSNPLTDELYDIKNDPIFTADGARLAVGIAWDTADYNNTGNQSDGASQVQANALADSASNGDGSYAVVMPIAVPNGSLAPGIATSGSGTATLEGHPVIELDENNDGNIEPVEVPVGDAHRFFSIDEADGLPNERRQSVDIAKCNNCHSSLVLHGGNRSDNINSCVTCHNPRNTDRGVRELGKQLGRAQATDGKDEESIDFKTMIHAIHAADMRENPLQVIGFMAFSNNIYDESAVQYPGNLANCTSCHTDEGFQLPLASGVLATSVHTGSDTMDPSDDTVVTAATSVCSSCHDGAEAKAHMVLQGGNFATSQSAIDSGAVIETCSTCHGAGRSEDAWETHQAFLN